MLERPPLRLPHRLRRLGGAPVPRLRDGARPLGARPAQRRSAGRRRRGRQTAARHARPRRPRGGPAPLPHLRRAGPAQDPLQDGHLAAGQLPRRAAVRGRRPRPGPHRAGVPRHAVAHRRAQRGGARAGDGVDPPAGVPGAQRREAHDYGFVRYRPRGEYHLNNPEAAKTLRRACVEGLPDLYRSYSEKLAQRPPTVLRDLLRLVGDGRPERRRRRDRGRALADGVEPAAAILPRFCTGGMSLGALSREAHETIAVAMARIHGRANSGEGGEDAERDVTIEDVDPDGPSRRASRTCRGSRTATGPPRRSARSPPGASASRRPTWPAPTSSRSRSPRAPSRARAASCPATRSPRTSPACAAPPPASRSSRRRRTTTSTRSRTSRSSSTTCAWSTRAPASR